MNDVLDFEVDYEQFRMSRLQVFNWGTFSAWHDIKIATRGFLFVGGSGSGKSTLLDAIATLLVPPRWIDFNAAARETDRSGRDRNLVSYVRGAYAEQKDIESGIVSTQYLRSGNTWSAISLSFQNGRGRTVTLLQVFYIRGTGSDVNRNYFILDRSLDLSELEGFDLDIRKLKAKLGDAIHRTEFSSYCERFRRTLQIDNEMALRLLHKTQSAKNLGDLNPFLREFMLDKPETFDAAARLVQEFGELNACHQTVVTARQQVETLKPARDNFEKWESEKRQCQSLNDLKNAIDIFAEMKRRDLLDIEFKNLEIQRESIISKTIESEERLQIVKDELEDLQLRHRELGGEQIEQWEKERETQKAVKEARLRKLAQVEDACKELDWERPDSPETLSKAISNARDFIENSREREEQLTRELVDLSSEKGNSEKELSLLKQEIESLQRQSSNIPFEMLRMRKQIATALSLHESVLPFVGELIEVNERERKWQGAIERVLRGFALSMLVEEKHFVAVSKYVNENNLRNRLVFHRTGSAEKSKKNSKTFNSLITKLNLQPGAHQAWLQAELNSRFDYECVSSEQELRKVDRGVTIEGMVRHGNTRFEKDDRKAVDDRKTWLLGFDNREKLALYKSEEEQISKAIDDIANKIKSLNDKRHKSAQNARSCVTLSQVQWSEIDVKTVLLRLDHLEKQIVEAQKGNSDLSKVAGQIAKQKEKIKKSENELTSLGSDLKTTDKEIQKRQLESKRTDAVLEEQSIDQEKTNALQDRLSQLAVELTLDNLDRQVKNVERGIANDVAKKMETISNYAQLVQNSFATFKNTWKMESANMDTSMDSAPDFFALLTRLESDGLPTHEQKFFDMLQTQSHQNLTALNSYIKQGRRQIHERMEVVNASLLNAEFNKGTRLVIDTTDRQLEAVRDFMNEIKDALSFNLSTEDRDEAEKRFEILRTIVRKLESEEPELKRWREAVLDVRQHVDFVAREIDVEGKQIEIYRSGAGKSGGQRQKLTTTCLAAALHYQLSRSESQFPSYAAIVLDEAFDKADNEFTKLAMQIFCKFGFQMIVATPLKSIMTLEEFVGGACFVDIKDRKASKTIPIPYNSETSKLDLQERNSDEPTVEIN